MGNHYKKIKIAFSAIILLLIVGIAGGGFAMKNNNFFTGKQVSQTINYLNYKLSFAQANDKNLTAAVVSILNSTTPTIKNNDDNAKSIPVLLYHGIINEPDGANVLLENFKEQMFALKKAGWQTVSIEDFYAFMQGKKELPDKSFLLTFDDGRKDSYYPVDPILKALDYNAVIFVISKRSLGDEKEISSFHLSENELKRMIKSKRWDIQPHTRDGHDFYVIDGFGNKGHFYSNKLWLEDENRVEIEEEFIKRITADFEGAKMDIENFGVKSIGFAFPFGDYGQESVNFPEAKNAVLNTVKSIYSLAFYQIWPGSGFSFNYPGKDSFMIKRISVKPEWETEDLLKVLEKGMEKDFPYKDNFSEDRGWIKTRGNLLVKNSFLLKENSMVVGADDSTSGGSVFLDGSYLWKDYIFKAKVDWSKGSNILLTARYQDDSNFTACNFGEKTFRIEEKRGGKKQILAETKKEFNLPKDNLEIGIKVNGNKVECLLNNEVIVFSDNLSPDLANGGIGFKTWDSQVNNSELIIKKVSVEEIK